MYDESKIRQVITIPQIMPSVYLRINCGFSRVAIRTLSESGSGKKHSQIDRQCRESAFKELFCHIFKDSLPSTYFKSDKGRQSLFDRHCSKILYAFRQIKCSIKRQCYIETFSIDSWKALTQLEKEKHTLQTCIECALTKHDLQAAFPGPTYTPTMSGFAREVEVLSRDMLEPELTRNILSELQPVYERTFGISFTTALSGLQQRQTEVERRKNKRRVQQQCRDQIYQQMRATDALDVLSEGLSLKSYKRLRMSQGFETPEAKLTRSISVRKHSPKFEMVSWDKENVIEDLRQWPVGKIINWSEFARKHGTAGKNAGQVAKEFARESGIDVFSLDNRRENTRVRARKLKMTGGVSVPTHSTVTQIKEDFSNMIQDGTLTLGEPCHPHTLVRYSTSGGTLTRTEVVCYGRKIPLTTIREKLIKKHEELMHLHSNEEIEQMDKHELEQLFEARNMQLPDIQSEDNLRMELIKNERTRTLGVWHDHSSILGHGYVLITIKVLYDRAVFKTENERRTVQNVQSVVEEPEIHLIAMSSSCIDALIQERLMELANCVHTSKGIPINDRLKFFYGDKPAAQFERGSQQGGHYPCGTCGSDAMI